MFFGSSGNADKFKLDGWSRAEGVLTWTDGVEASINLPVSKPYHPVTLKAYFRPYFAPGRVKSQRVNVLVNGRAVGTWTIKRKGFKEHTLVVLPGFFTDPERTVITFQIPDARAPADMGESIDTRRLGIAVKTMVLGR